MRHDISGRASADPAKPGLWFPITARGSGPIVWLFMDKIGPTSKRRTLVKLLSEILARPILSE